MSRRDHLFLVYSVTDLIEAILRAPKITMLMISLRKDFMVSAENERGRAPVNRACHKKSLVKAIFYQPMYEQGSSVFWFWLLR